MCLFREWGEKKKGNEEIQKERNDTITPPRMNIMVEHRVQGVPEGEGMWVLAKVLSIYRRHYFWKEHGQFGCR
jgi:hypothetical protein